MLAQIKQNKVLVIVVVIVGAALGYMLRRRFDRIPAVRSLPTL